MPTEPLAIDDDPVHRWTAERRRRRWLVGAGVVLLALGAVTNADRIARRWRGARPPVHHIAFDEHTRENRFVGYMKQPDEAPAPDVEQQRQPERGGSAARHKGEEGVLGRPSAGRKAGLYAMKGPHSAVAVRPGEGEDYGHVAAHGFVATSEDPRSTFAIDVDTASYANVRRFLVREAVLPPADAIRTEELVNYFDYGDAPPDDDQPIAVHSEVAPCPWAPEHRLVRIGIRAAEPADIGPRNLVFLVDTSGSMEEPDKLPLVQDALGELAQHIDDRDRIAIVAYAGAAGLVLSPTSGADRPQILRAIDRLSAGGSTNGGAGIELAYRLARDHFIEGGVNRVVLATDGDFNVGTTSHEELMALVERERKTGVFLSVLGFGTGDLHDHTMEQLADRGNGNYAYIDGPLEARKVLVHEADSTLVTVAKDVKISVEFDPDRVVRHRLVGYDNRRLEHEDFADDRKDGGEMGAGHTVTALYEIEPTEEDDGDFARVDVRYKAPDGDESELIGHDVEGEVIPLDAASEDLRFAAAVAAFAERLRGAPTSATHADVYALAEDALGADPFCERHEFLALVHRAGSLAGESMPGVAPRCTAASIVATHVHPGHARPRAWSWATIGRFALEVLRLLPPLLALPLFVMAILGPRRRRGTMR